MTKPYRTWWRGFGLYTRHVNIIFDRGMLRDWYFEILVGWRNPPFNKGAGYKGGATFYIAWRCRDRDHLYRPRLFQMGITQNGNRTPWTSH